MPTLGRLTFVFLIVGFSIGCQRKTAAHEGAWVHNGKDAVVFVHFGAQNQVVLTAEVYHKNVLLDGMKVEVHATCQPQEKSYKADTGRYTLQCTDMSIVRSSKGLAQLNLTLKLMEAFLDEDATSSDAPEVFTVEIQRDASDMITHTKSDDGPVKTRYTPVASSKIEPFLAKFRKGTVPFEDKKRKRHLP